jgi:hypothetical protein
VEGLAIEHMQSIHIALGFIPSTKKKNEGGKKREREKEKRRNSI